MKVFAIWLNLSKKDISKILDVTHKFTDSCSMAQLQKDLTCDQIIKAENIMEAIAIFYKKNHLPIKLSFLYGVTDVAKELNWSKQRVTTYKSRGIIPEPIGHIGGRPVWLKIQITELKKQYGIHLDEQ